MLKKYTLNTLLLYLSNQLSQEEAREISTYLINNKKILSYVIQLSKIKSYTEARQNRIFFNEFSGIITSLCSGIVELLDEKKLAFRGTHDAWCYKYKFISTDLSLIKINNQWNIHIITSESLHCQIVSENLEILLDKQIEGSYQLTVENDKDYYLFIENHNQQDVLELLL